MRTQWSVLVVCKDMETAQKVKDVFVPIVVAENWSEAMATAKIDFELIAGMSMEQFGVKKLFVKDSGIYPC